MAVTLYAYQFKVWWSCTRRPFFAAEQIREVAAFDEFQALSVVLAAKPVGPFLHDCCCCYVSDVVWRR